MEMEIKDRISSLPVHLIEHILEGLPLEDRAKTSVLSSKWRYLWTQVPSLVFDRSFYLSTCEFKRKPLSDYIDNINNIVLQHPRNVREVSFYIPEEDVEEDQEPTDFSLFHDLIKRFLCDGVERLHLKADRIWPISPSIFSPAVISLAIRLKHLYLLGCDFFPPSSSTQLFPSLVSVDLNVLQTSTTAISCFLSSCPKLQKIKMGQIEFPQQYLDINAPELNYLHVDGIFKWMHLSSAEKIEVLIIDMEELPHLWSEMGGDISKLFDRMSKLEKMSFRREFFTLMAAHSNHALQFPIYDGLKSLDFQMIDLKDKTQFLYMWNFIARCINLTELSFTWLTVCDTNPYAMKDEAEFKTKLNNLQKVSFDQLCDTSVLMKLVELLLLCSPALKVMSIEFHFHYDDKSVSKLVEEIMKFNRASSKAKIYTSHHPCIDIDEELVLKIADALKEV